MITKMAKCDKNLSWQLLFIGPLTNGQYNSNSYLTVDREKGKKW